MSTFSGICNVIDEKILLSHIRWLQGYRKYVRRKMVFDECDGFCDGLVDSFPK